MNTTIKVGANREARIVAHGLDPYLVVLDVMIKARGVRFSLLLDDDFRPRLMRTFRLDENAKGDLRPYVEAAEEFLRDDPTTLGKLVSCRAQMDLDSLKREREALKDFLDNAKPETEGPLAVPMARVLEWHRKAALTLEFRTNTLKAFHTKIEHALATADLDYLKGFEIPRYRDGGVSASQGDISRAIDAGWGTAFRGDPLCGVVDAAIRETVRSGYGVESYSYRTDPAGPSHDAYYEGMDRRRDRRNPHPTRPSVLAQRIDKGLIDGQDLLVVECTAPMHLRVVDFTSRVVAKGIDPMVMAFDAERAVVGRASKLKAAYLGTGPMVREFAEREDEVFPGP